MKYRSIGGLFLALAVALGACAPPDAGASGAWASPSVQVSNEASEAAAPAPTEDDEY